MKTPARISTGLMQLYPALLTVGAVATLSSNHAALRQEPPDYCSLEGVGGIYGAVDSGVPALAAVGRISRIPEFHDCQRFVEGNAFGATYAIYATEGLGTFVFETHYRLVAVIRAPEAGYEPLGIERGWNCLYLTLRDGLPQARMRHRTESGCKEVLADIPEPPEFARQQHLNWAKQPFADGFDSTDFPPAARWEWDHTKNRYDIGVRCGPAWCRVRRHSGAWGGYKITNAHGKRGRRTGEIPGWHDEQRLATMVNGRPVLGPVAIVFADSNLDRDPKLYDDTWQSVAFVAMSRTDAMYERKYGFVGTPMGNQMDLSALNVVALCRGAACEIPATQRSTLAQCQKATAPAEQWWVRTGPPRAEPGNPDAWKYKCAARHGHENQQPFVTIPAAVRWRWSDRDETIWIRCGEGCCEVDS